MTDALWFRRAWTLEEAEDWAREYAAAGKCPCMREEEADGDPIWVNFIGPLPYCPEHGHFTVGDDS